MAGRKNAPQKEAIRRQYEAELNKLDKAIRGCELRVAEALAKLRPLAKGTPFGSWEKYAGYRRICAAGGSPCFTPPGSWTWMRHDQDPLQLPAGRDEVGFNPHKPGWPLQLLSQCLNPQTCVWCWRRPRSRAANSPSWNWRRGSSMSMRCW